MLHRIEDKILFIYYMSPELIIDEQININNISQPEELPMYTTA
jgi:hypothetical protein